VTVLLFDFADVTHAKGSTLEYYAGIVREMNASYYRQSYGKMWIVGGEIYGWYSTSLRLSELKVTTWYIQYADADKLERLATQKAGELHISGYVFAVFAGPVWAWATGHPSFLSVVGETRWDKSGFLHEFGHNLGLPDLYNYENLNAEPVGQWDLMDQGEEELSAWSRVKLGWIAADSVVTIDTSRTHALATVLVSPLDEPNGIRELRVQVYGTNAFFLAENRQGTETGPAGYGRIRLIIYYIQGSIESGKGSIVVMANLSLEGNAVYVGAKADFAFVLLNVQPDGLKIQITTKTNGEIAQRTVESLRSANVSVVTAWGDNRLEGFSEAQRELNKAWEAYENADFDSATSLAGKATELAQLAKVPQSYTQFEELRPNLAAQLLRRNA